MSIDIAETDYRPALIRELSKVAAQEVAIQYRKAFKGVDSRLKQREEKIERLEAALRKARDACKRYREREAHHPRPSLADEGEKG